MLGLLSERADPALDPRLRAAVAAHAGRWAVSVAGPGRAFASERVPGALVDGARAFAEADGAADAPAALAELLGPPDGPVLLVGADVPRLDADLAAAALGDLRAGCALSFAPSTDGRPFLLAFARATPESLALVGAPDRPREEIFAAAIALGGEVGMLRSERRLVTLADARALAADPVASRDLRDLARSD